MFNVPPNTLYMWVISGTGFYGSNDLTNNVKALKEDRFYGHYWIGSSEKEVLITFLESTSDMIHFGEGPHSPVALVF